ncbi:hypothetical protein FA13DRAFT_287702 [Coprinellus micaceus]|uniref:DUF6533 domain-containing protein n=1 Tax=Coprinellus micaceus TaxID=71717 RepID=A0A4Y7TF34_COPMI|nr:hypothetical protein FA13DRAFT_287702 [Coprinellus micaceus]
MSMLTGAQSAAAQVTALEYIIDGYNATKYTNYLGVGGFALIVADYLHTLPDEVRLMWPSPLSTPKVLFYILRYYLFIHHVLTVLYGERVDLTPEECYAGFVRVTVSSAIVITIAEAILFLRVYAFSGKQRSMLIYLSIQFVAVHAGVFGVLARYISTVKYVKYPFNNMTCMPSTGESELLGITFALLLTSVVVVMLMMMYIAFLKHRDLNNALMMIFYRDGIFYFICISALASTNIFVNFFAPHGYKFLFVQTEVDIHVILATRMLLHLRRWAERERVGATANGRTPQTRSSFVCGSEEPVDYATSLDYWATDFGDADDVGYELARKDQKSPQSPSSSDHLV